jgi:hypothetical protein
MLDLREGDIILLTAPADPKWIGCLLLVTDPRRREGVVRIPNLRGAREVPYCVPAGAFVVVGKVTE